ncbi:putative integral membrane protein [Cryptosporidium felis]|nr:putative integral membrane protein [Cryptosporidium felis]
MKLFNWLLSFVLLLLTTLYILLQITKKSLQKRGFKVTFSISGFFSLSNLGIRIHPKYLEKYDIGGFELHLFNISLKIQSWKLRILLSQSLIKFIILNRNRLSGLHFSKQNQSNLQSSLEKAVNNDSIGIIRNLMFIVIVQIISRIISLEFKDIKVQFSLTDCKCNEVHPKVGEDGSCQICGTQMRYGLGSQLTIQTLNILPKAYFGGIMIHFSLRDPVIYLGPLENTLSEKRCHTFYLDSKNKVERKPNSEFGNYSNLLTYILLQFQKKVKSQETANEVSSVNCLSHYPPLLFVQDNLDINLKLMHSMSGSDIRVSILRNINIELTHIWITLIPEILCELIYTFRILRPTKKAFRRLRGHCSNSESLNFDALNNPPRKSPRNQLQYNLHLPFPSSPLPPAPPSSPFSNNTSGGTASGSGLSKVRQKLIVNENLDRQLQIDCKISHPTLIYCDNTNTSSGFEIIFQELEAHFIIQYFIEYLQTNTLGLFSSAQDDYDEEDEEDEEENDEDQQGSGYLEDENFEFDLLDEQEEKKPYSKKSQVFGFGKSEYENFTQAPFNKKTRTCLNLVFASKLIFGNSLYLLDKKNSLNISKQILKSTIVDGNVLFDRMFIVEGYKSLVEVSDNNFVKFYMKNSIQKMFGLWKENGFYQNITSFLQLIKFNKYLSKIEVLDPFATSSPSQNNEIESPKPEVPGSYLENSDNIPKVPKRAELEEELLRSDFPIKSNKHLKEILSIKDFVIKLLFYFEIKEVIIQTNDISCLNDDLAAFNEEFKSNGFLECRDCLIDSFGPTDRYLWKTNFDLKREVQEKDDSSPCKYHSVSGFQNESKDQNRTPDMESNEYRASDVEKKDKFFVLSIRNLKFCNTSLTRSFSMLFKGLDLYILDDFIDLEDISIKYLDHLIPGSVNSKKTCIYRFGCIDQRFETRSFLNNGQSFFKEFSRHLVKLKEIVLTSPWDAKKISLKFKKLDGELGTNYVPLYLYILGCYSIDCLAIKMSNLNKVYYGINYQFEENFDFYCRKRSEYYQQFELVRENLIRIFQESNPQNACITGSWKIPDIILSKSNSTKYTWYLDFEDISVSFLSNFRLLADKLSLYRCNEYGNYDILLSGVRISDPYGIHILSSDILRFRSDLPFQSVKINSPICLKKQLRRILDLSVNGDLLLLSIIGNQRNSLDNLRDINNGLIYFDSKRFILQAEYLRIHLLANSHYLDSLLEYIYQFVYITYYQLFHPPLIIRVGKLLSFSRQHPIIFSCNNIFDIDLKKVTLNIGNLPHFLLDHSPRIPTSVHLREGAENMTVSPQFQDDIKVYYLPETSKSDSQTVQKIFSSDLLGIPILETKLENLKLDIRTKHLSNRKSSCDERECYSIPNGLTNSRITLNNFLISPKFNPLNVFGSSTGLSLSLFSQLTLTGSKVPVASRREVSISNEGFSFDIRRKYSKFESHQEIKQKPILGCSLETCIFSRSKTFVYISNANSHRAIYLLKPLSEIANKCLNLERTSGLNHELPKNDYSNVEISDQTLRILLKASDQTNIYLAPHTNENHLRELNENSSVNIQIPKIHFLFCSSFRNTRIATTVRMEEGILVNLLLKNFFSCFTSKKSQGVNSFSRNRRPFQDNDSIANNPKTRFTLKSNLVSLSRVRFGFTKKQDFENEIRLVISGLDRELISKKRSPSNEIVTGRPENLQNFPLTLELDSERLVQLLKVLESFMDERMYAGVSLFHCLECSQLKVFRQVPSLRNPRDAGLRTIPLLNWFLNLSVGVSLENINLRYEIFGILVNQIGLETVSNSFELEKFRLLIKDTRIIAECFPYRLSQLAKSCMVCKPFRDSSIQLSCLYSRRTKVTELSRIGEVSLDLGDGKSVLLIIKGTKLTLNALTLMYLDLFFRLIGIMGAGSKGLSQKSSGEFSALNSLKQKKFNIQISEILVNSHAFVASRDLIPQSGAKKIRFGSSRYSGAAKAIVLPDLDTQNDLIQRLIEENPVSLTFTCVEDRLKSNEDLSIFCESIQECSECRFLLNRSLLYTSRIFVDLKDKSLARAGSNFHNILTSYANNFYSHLEGSGMSTPDLRFQFELFQEYRRICQYTEGIIGPCLEYGQIIEDVIFQDSISKKVAGIAIITPRSFRQVVCRVPKIDCFMGINENGPRIEFVLKIHPICMEAALSNKLIWDLSEATNYRLCKNENMKLGECFRKNEEEESSNQIPEASENRTFISQERLPLVEEKEFLESTQQILKTAPIFVNIRILTEKASTQLKMYSRILSISIDSFRVQSINEILHSIELGSMNSRIQTSPVPQSTPNPPSSFSGSNPASSTNNPPISNTVPITGSLGNSLPPPIYYSHMLSVGTPNTGNSELLSNNINGYPFKTPSTFSLSSYLNDQKFERNLQRVNLLDLFGVVNKKVADSPSYSSLDLSSNRMLLFNDLNDKNASNLLKFEIDKYLANNPLCFTMVDNIQAQSGIENSQTNQHKLQIECVIEKLNVDMYISMRIFSNFQSTDINFLMLSSSLPSKSTIIEFDSSFVHLSARKEFLQSSSGNISGTGFSSSNGNPNGNFQILDIHSDANEQISIIHPMYLDGHTSQGHGHVLSIRINMRQIKLLEFYNIKILESVVIRVHPIRVNITQYLTSCYYNIFFPSQDRPSAHQNPETSALEMGSPVLPDGNNENYMTNSPCYEVSNTPASSENTGSILHLGNQNVPQSPQNNPAKNILYFNYLRISSILVEVTYRGSVSLNKVLLELGSFTQRRKQRSVKEMVDKYISFLRRQSARPVLSHTFKQLRHSLLPKQFKSHKRSNFNSQLSGLPKENHDSSFTNKLRDELLEPISSQLNPSDSLENSVNPKEPREKALSNSRNQISLVNTRNDSEYNKFRLIFGNQLLL